MRRVPMDIVLPALKKAYPGADCTLNYRNPLELLVATILSAQCTDKRVNEVTKTLFKKYRSAQDYVHVPIAELEQDIRSCGTYRMKARAIKESCSIIIEQHGGVVPQTMAELTQLRGVGRKTAAIVLGCAYGIIDGIPVDTHVTRVSKRLGLTRHTEQSKIEKDLMAQTPHEDWMAISHLLIAHGRAICIARRPKCEVCMFQDVCPSSLTRKVSTTARRRV